MSEYPDLSRASAPVTRYDSESSEQYSNKAEHSQEHGAGGPQLSRSSLTAYLEKRSPNLARSSVARAEQEILQRSYYPLACNISLGIKEIHSGQKVFYKFDGSRFKYADATIKVSVGVTYELSVSIKPHLDFANNLLSLRSSLEGIQARQHVVSLSKNRVDGKNISGNWKCDLDPNKKGERYNFEISGKITHFGDFSIPLLLKVYPEENKGAYQGFRLRTIVLELKRKQEDATQDANLVSCIIMETITPAPLYELQIPNVVRPSRYPTVESSLVVIDNGAHELRAGFATNAYPLLKFPNQLIKPRSRWSNDLETVVGDRNVSIRGFDFGRAAVRSPFDSNVVVNYETEEAILDYVFDRLGFQSPLENHPVVMTECLLNPSYSRNTMMELLFESYDIPRVVFTPDCLAAFNFNQKSGTISSDAILMSSGHSATHVLPIVNGEAMLFNAQRSKICGYQSTLHLQQLTLLHNPQCAASLSKRTVGLMKEQCTLCSQDYLKDLEKLQAETSPSDGLGMRIQLPKSVISSGSGNEIDLEISAADKTMKAEEQKSRLKAMSLKRKQNLIQKKQEFLKYWKEIQIQIAETEAEDVKESILNDAEVETEKDLQKLIADTEAAIERLTDPSTEMKHSPTTTSVSGKSRLATEDNDEKQEENLDTVRARYKALTEQLESKKRSRINTASGIEGSSNKRVTYEQRRRMKLVAEAAAVGEDDDFGADDRDWDVYKEMDPHHSDSDFEKQTEAELQLTRNKLRDLGENIVERDVFGKELGKEGQLDQNQVYLSVERIRVPELLFQPCLMGINQAGIPEIVSRVLKSLPKDLASRCEKELLMYGGNSVYPGLEQRLASELCSLCPLGQPMKVVKAIDCFLDAWRGAALFAQSQVVLDYGYSTQEYSEMGLNVVHRKRLPFIHYPD